MLPALVRVDVPSHIFFSITMITRKTHLRHSTSGFLPPTFFELIQVEGQEGQKGSTVRDRMSSYTHATRSVIMLGLQRSHRQHEPSLRPATSSASTRFHYTRSGLCRSMSLKHSEIPALNNISLTFGSWQPDTFKASATHDSETRPVRTQHVATLRRAQSSS